MSQRIFGAGVAVVALLSLIGAVPGTHATRSAAYAQEPRSARATCAGLLTDVEVLAATGRRGATSEKQESAPGNSQCRWEWTDTGATLTVSYSDADAIAAMRDVTKCCPQPSASVVAQFFDHTVRVAVDLGADPPAALSGIGQRAALFFEDNFLKLVVQRPDGVAQIVGANVTREQLLAVGRAIAAP